MKPLYLTAALALTLAAAGLTWQLNAPPPRPATGSRLAAADLANQRLPAAKPTPTTDALVPAPLQDDLAQATVEHNLFHPNRRPPVIETEQEDAPSAAPTEKGETYTLVSVAQIGTRAVASIAIQAAPAEPVSATASTRGRPPLPVGRKTPSPTSTVTSERALYQVGDKVGSSGYVLDAIELDRVILKRGMETKELAIDVMSSDSVSRRVSAARNAPREAATGPVIRTLADPFAASTARPTAPPASATRPNAATTDAARMNAPAATRPGAQPPENDATAPTSGVIDVAAEPIVPPGVTAGRASRQSRDAAEAADGAVDGDDPVFVMPPGGLPPPLPPGGLGRPNVP